MSAVIIGTKTVVDSVDSGGLTIQNPHNSADHAGGNGLVPPAKPLVDSVDSEAALTVDPYSPGEKWAYADQKSGRVFFITQDAEHPKTSEVLLTQERIEKVLAKRRNDQFAWVCHDKDRYTEEDVKRNSRAVLGELKARHFHIVEKRRSVATVGQVARAYGVAPQYVEAKPAEAFGDLCEYLTHEGENQQRQGKYLYPDDEINSNFDFREFIDTHVAGRRNGRRRVSKLTDVDVLALRVQEEGLTLAEAKQSDPLAFSRGESRLSRARAAYLGTLPQPPHRINYYLFGDGGCGKDALARALARVLVPGDWIPGEREPFFVVGGDNETWENYDGEPVVIIEEARAGSLIKSFGRKELFSFLNPFPGKQRMNVKNSSTLPVNLITIMTGPDDYETFLDGLAGEYVDRSGEKHHAENKAQSYRRVPIIIPVREAEFDLMVNKGFVDGTGEFREYYAFQGFRQGMRQVLTRVKGIADEQRRVETHLALEARQVEPIREQHEVVVAATRTEDEDADVLLAEFADLGTQATEEERAASREARMLDVAAHYGLRYAEHFRAAHLSGLDTPDMSAGMFLDDCCVAMTYPRSAAA